MSFDELRNVFYEERQNKDFKKKYKDMFSTEKPYVVKVSKGYEAAFERREELILEGELVLGAMVMGNTLLFKAKNKYDCPALFIYSYENYFEENQEKLAQLAHEIYNIRELSEEVLSKNLVKKEIADYLNDEETPQFNIEIPKQLSYGRAVFMTSIVVKSSDIKNGTLTDALYPLIIKKGIISGMLLDYKFYDNEGREQNRIKKIRKEIITGIIIIAGLALSPYFNSYILTGIIVFLVMILWS